MAELNARIKNYWEGEAQGYTRAIEDEHKGFKRKAWTDLILDYSPDIECLDVLDIGTGPSFFPIVLTQAGHNVTGIDLTQKMIEFARRNCANKGVIAKLITMDFHKLSFQDNSFDLLICRNLTWTLDIQLKLIKSATAY